LPGAPAVNVTIDGGRFGIVSGGIFALNPNRGIALGSTAGTSFTVPGGAGDLTYNGVFSDLTTGGILVKQGAGILDIGGVSTYTGATSVNNGSVRLNVGANRLPVGTTVTLGQAGSNNLGTLDLNGFNQEIAGLISVLGTNASAGSKNIVTTATAATLTISGTGSYSYGDSTNVANPGLLSGALNVIKKGTGTQTLGDANTYTGATTVMAGTLLVTNTVGSGTGTSVVNVFPGGTLGGTGTITGVVSFPVSNGVLAPGVAGAGTLAHRSAEPEQFDHVEFRSRHRQRQSRRDRRSAARRRAERLRRRGLRGGALRALHVHGRAVQQYGDDRHDAAEFRVCHRHQRRE